MLTDRLDPGIDEESIAVEERVLRKEFDLLLRRHLAQTVVGQNPIAVG